MSVRLGIDLLKHLNLGLAPQALCLRLLSQAKKHRLIETLRAKLALRLTGFNCYGSDVCGMPETTSRDVLVGNMVHHEIVSG